MISTTVSSYDGGGVAPVPWWGWLLLIWCALAVAGAFVLGAVIRVAERHRHRNL